MKFHRDSAKDDLKWTRQLEMGTFHFIVLPNSKVQLTLVSKDDIELTVWLEMGTFHYLLISAALAEHNEV